MHNLEWWKDDRGFLCALTMALFCRAHQGGPAACRWYHWPDNAFDLQYRRNSLTPELYEALFWQL